MNRYSDMLALGVALITALGSLNATAGEIELYVLKEDGSPVSGARVYATNGHRRAVEVTALPRGRFMIDTHDETTIYIKILHSGFHPGSLTALYGRQAEMTIRKVIYPSNEKPPPEGALEAVSAHHSNFLELKSDQELKRYFERNKKSIINLPIFPSQDPAKEEALSFKVFLRNVRKLQAERGAIPNRP